ncbi:MAG: tRNA (adenosine(37)-N6)-dimethylallyltransferase MiaA [Planctomycetes bacterium]|nr:tRNA (adenosine(37)-N6)-dimethylallyltransferase MiaA [Planctomycetota bacterium]
MESVSNRLDTLLAEGVHALIGPTASGKSALALRVAEAAGAELVALDSMQVYRGMDVGTAKSTPSERARVRHHLLDLCAPSADYDVARFQTDLADVLDDLARRRVRALFVGGTGFYLKVLLERLFEGPPVDRALRARLEARCAAEGNAALHAELARVDAPSAARIHANDTKRLVRALEVHAQTGKALSEWQREWSSFTGGAAARGRPRRLVGLALDVPELDRRIAARVDRMLDLGWEDEVRAIEVSGGFSKTAIQALGYAEVRALVRGETSRELARARIALATRQFARRQRTWYRKFPETTWLAAAEPAENSSAEAARVRAALRALGWD